MMFEETLLVRSTKITQHPSHLELRLHVWSHHQLGVPQLMRLDCLRDPSSARTLHWNTDPRNHPATSGSFGLNTVACPCHCFP
mmetsp:Transcript_7325/g.27408  ORF Transcript_7325/g.27408 Transcript_7325/m.27408 type:complete len:83 (+) Transcript_7325:217-465(+)